MSLGSDGKADQVLTLKMKKWWNETEQQTTLGTTSLNNENYGITIEKAVWDPSKKRYNPVIMDAYSYFPPPGYFAKVTEMPYQIHAYPVEIDKIEKQFNVKDVGADDVRTILGIEDREDVRPNATLDEHGVGIVNQQSKGTSYTTEDVDGNNTKALVIECWIKDRSTHSVTVKDPDGNPILDEEGKEQKVTEQKYLDGIRVISVVNTDKVLNDMGNPNINWTLPPSDTSNTFAWGQIPMYKVNSYDDTTSIWGFSAAEQTGPLNKKIDEIISRMVAYCNRALFPTLILEQGCGITKSMINTKPNLVLMPARPNARIEYLQIPNLPSNFFDILNTLVSFHDRIYQIEDADRGVQPTGVTAASAIATLQERNAVLIRHKIRSIEHLVRMRGRWHISFMQNFGIQKEEIFLKDDTVFTFRGIDLVGKKFNIIVQSNSTISTSSVHKQQQSMELYGAQAIDRIALLEDLNYPNRKQVIERMGETQLDEALNILVQSGLDEDQAVQLKQFLMQPQEGPEAPTEDKVPAGQEAI